MIARLRDPLVHFLVLGLAIFALGRGPEAEAIIEIDAGLIADLRAILTQDLERAPTEDEVKRAVDGWIEQEVLVREARARGLDRGDPQIRARLAEKMAFVIGAAAVPPEPDEATLQALYAAQQDQWRVTLQVSLRQCFAGAERARAEALLAYARGGATDAQLAERCDPPPGGPVLRGRSVERLVARYGEAFVADLDTTPEGAWHLRRSTLGWHVTRIEARRAGRPIAFEEARTRLVAQWQRDRLDAAREHTLAAVRARYTVRGWPR